MQTGLEDYIHNTLIEIKGRAGFGQWETVIFGSGSPDTSGGTEPTAADTECGNAQPTILAGFGNKMQRLNQEFL